ncbi:NAD-dependent epimerase/dehydratase family protein [uncultured Roseovarius sp.]|jgi:nucleoside-diphosphate-sugar epimerase|uniref:NAD-dependent epimerase/dehydratase family protein n=1 Tax=uncultured Roseovarius sp. TaxID=293344 RepID=UPI00261D3B4C|nr:NAD-dependent epimerase/dehydratase family protein [uncultured Roseovarius sp.]
MTGPVAVTGASGFVGRALIGQLLEAGRPVRALVHRQGVGLSHPKLETVTGGLSDRAALLRLMDGAHAVIHVAGKVRGRDLTDFLGVNADGVTHVAEAAQAAGLRRVILISSLAAREPQLSPYAASKRTGEERLAKAASGAAFTAAILRPPAIYGPEDRELVPLFQTMARGIVPLPGVPGARASLLHVDDLAQAIVKLLDSPAQGTYELHDGHEAGYGWDEIAAIVERVAGRGPGWRLRIPEHVLRSVAGINLLASRLFGYMPMLTPGKVNELRHPDWVCDNTEISRDTGWQPLISLENGLSSILRGTPLKSDRGISNVT